MKRFLSLFFSVNFVLLLSACSTVSVNTPEVSDAVQEQNVLVNFSAISVSDFLRLHETAEYVMIDVRTDEEIAKGKIDDDALEIDYYADDFKDRIAELDTSKKYLVHCASGGRSGKTMSIMSELGFEEAYDLAGGMQAYLDR